jgi:hypothetical protein
VGGCCADSSCSVRLGPRALTASNTALTALLIAGLAAVRSALVTLGANDGEVPRAPEEKSCHA